MKGSDYNDGAARLQLMRLAQVAEATASAVIITDIDGVIVWVNDGFTRVTGYSFEEAVGRIPGKLLQGPATNRSEVARVGEAVRARRSVSAELINYHKDGRSYWVGMKIEPLQAADGNIDGFMAIEADITQRHEHNQAMEQLTRRFNMATRAARIGMFERDAGGENVWWSDVMFEVFGQDPGSFSPSLESWLGLVHPDDHERVRGRASSLGESIEASNARYRIIRPDGSIRHIESIGAAADTCDGIANRIAGITLDITEKVQAEEREYALQQQLRENSHQAGMAEIATGALHNVGNVLNSLGIANTTARRNLQAFRLDRLEQATALLSSNRATLASFLTNDERGRHLPDYLAALAAQISANAQTLQAELDTTAHLLHHLRDIITAQQDVAQTGGRHESIRLQDLVEIALFLQAADLAHIEVVRDYEELPAIVTDRHKLLQILVNFINNARDAVLTPATARPRIRVRLARDENHAVVCVEDSGVGMTAEVLEQMWRFGFTTKKNGHGFGLHNSANAAHEIGATIAAQSDGPGHGSRFTVRLPIDAVQSMVSGAAA